MNAGGFYDPDWNSNGAQPHGTVISNGVVVSDFDDANMGGGFVGFNKDNDFIINLDANYFDEVDKLKTELDSKRPIPKETLKSLKESINLEWTYNSNGIEGNTLTLRETQVVLEGITIGGKSIKNI